MERILQETVFTLKAHQRADTNITAIEAVKLRVNEKRHYDYESNSCVLGEVLINIQILRYIMDILCSGDYKFSERGTMDVAAKTKSYEKEFTTRCKSPLSDLNGAVHDVSVVATSVVKTMMITF
ncbi:hypothetical protein SADUNF_Sadunf16G0172400 [Salix dunnii]|uniref:Uncharacterized protein n=1 Tax=Salix dunnii TaxID=1413687 RepID=A0A835J932_9ROSI|nr:hypothetical protein SADUNF_Sadunf16G0172400 [Salix dunnii]